MDLTLNTPVQGTKTPMKSLKIIRKMAITQSIKSKTTFLLSNLFVVKLWTTDTCV